MATSIEWVKNPDGSKGETWNPITGCTKISAGCRNCYAERMAKRLSGRYGYPEAPDQFKVTLHPDKLDQPDHWRKPRKIFVCSMGDLFHEDVPDDFIFKVFETITYNGPCYRNQTEEDPEGKFWPGHIFQILTKRPQRMKTIMDEWIWRLEESASGLFGELLEWYSMEYNNILPHLWLGVTAENQEAANERIPWLLKTPAAIRFVSVEPMLGAVDLRIPAYEIGEIPNLHPSYIPFANTSLDWVICGGETGPGVREMKAEWAFDLYQQCRDAGVPFFFKKPGDAFKDETINLPTAREYPRSVIASAAKQSPNHVED